MEVSRFLTALRRHWLVAALILAFGLFGVFLYQQSYGTATAEATVAVLDPLVARSGAYDEAQITFDAVIRSRRLDDAVSAKLGISSGEVASKLSVTVVPALAGYNASPLYAVRATDRDPARALAIANMAAEQGRVLFIELNTPDPADIRLALAPQRAAAEDELSKAGSDFTTFVTRNDAVDLPTRLEKQRDLESSLQIAIYQAQADRAAASARGDWTEALAASKRVSSFTGSLRSERAEADRLTTLEPVYYELILRVQTARDHLTLIDQQEHGQLAGQALPFSSEVKILDQAKLQSSLLWIVSTYAIGVILGLVVGASVIYAIAVLEKSPETADQVAAAFRAPVLARLPKAGGG